MPEIKPTEVESTATIKVVGVGGDVYEGEFVL